MTTVTTNRRLASVRKLAGLAAIGTLLTAAGLGLASGTAHADPNNQGCDNNSCSIGQDHHRGNDGQNFDSNRGERGPQFDHGGARDGGPDGGWRNGDQQPPPPEPFWFGQPRGCLPFLFCPPS